MNDATPMNQFAIFSSGSGVMLWLGEAVDMSAALRAHNAEVAYVDVESDDPDDFIWAIQVSSREAELLKAWEDSGVMDRPELQGEVTVFSHDEAVRTVQ